MKTTILIIIAGLTFGAFAERTGTDERIHMCSTGPEAKFMGKNKTFRVHVIAGKSVKITRLSDKKWFRGVQNNSNMYVFEKTDGNFWPNRSQGGYFGDVEKDWTVAVQESQGVYDMERLNCKLVRTISELDPLSPTEILLEKIGGNAELANGGYEFKKYDVAEFDLVKEKAALQREKIRGCTWTYMDDKAAILKAVKVGAYDPKTAKSIQKLIKSPGLKGLIAYVSDNDVSCSYTFVWLYTKNGYKLELMYSQGD